MKKHHLFVIFCTFIFIIGCAFSAPCNCTENLASGELFVEDVSNDDTQNTPFGVANYSNELGVYLVSSPNFTFANNLSIEEEHPNLVVKATANQSYRTNSNIKRTHLPRIGTELIDTINSASENLLSFDDNNNGSNGLIGQRSKKDILNYYTLRSCADTVPVSSEMVDIEKIQDTIGYIKDNSKLASSGLKSTTLDLSDNRNERQYPDTNIP